MRPAVWILGACAAMLIGPGSADAQTAAHPCALMSQPVAAAINGGPVAAGQELHLPGPVDECFFAGDGNNGTVTVGELAPMVTGMTLAQVFEMSENNATGTVERLSGLGDEAYYLSSSGTFDLWILAGKMLLDLEAAPEDWQTPNPRREALMIAAARAALKGM